MSKSKRPADESPPNGTTTKKQKLAHNHVVYDTLAPGASSATSAAGTQTDSTTGSDGVMDVDLVASPEDDEHLSDPPSDDDEDEEDEEDDNTPVEEAPVRKTLLPPIQEAFIPWKAEIVTPGPNPFWGIKPVSGDPRPHADQPVARTSNAATNPSMWEDRTFRAKRGPRYVKFFGPCKPDDVDNLPDLDQEVLLVVKLMDMRPKSRRDPTPRRTPTFYQYPGGKPKDWNDNQAIKCINDRRSQAIERLTLDPPWTRLERSYLAQILTEHPNASIWEITERHNDRFTGKEFREDTTFTFTPFSDGRTVESVRNEYILYKPRYDKGEYPDHVRTRADNSVAGKALRASKLMEKSFGLPDKALEKLWDKEHNEDDNEDTRAAPKKRGTKTPKSVLNKVANGAIKKPAPKKKISKKEVEARLNMAKQEKLEDSDEELLELAGAYDSIDGEDTSGLSSVRGSPTSLADSDTNKQSAEDLEVEQAVEQISGMPKPAQAPKSLEATTEATAEAPRVENEAGTVENEAGTVENEAGTVERRHSFHAARKLDIDENYDDEEDEEL